MWIFNLQNLASLLGALADAFASALIAIYYGFLNFPTGFAYLTGALFAGIWGGYQLLFLIKLRVLF